MSEPSVAKPAPGLVETFEALVRRRLGDTVLTFVGDSGEELHVSYGALDVAACRIARQLCAHGRRGDRVLVAFDTGPEFAAALWGVLYAGMVAVPVDPPGPERATGNLLRMQGAARDAGASACLAAQATIDAVEQGPEQEDFASVSNWQVVQVADAPAPRGFREGVEDFVAVHAGAGELAALLYTSGSTGTPKGTLFRHGTLAAHVARRTRERAKGMPAHVDVEVNWLPMTHATAFAVLLCNCAADTARGVWLSPSGVMSAPERWLRTIAGQAPGLTVCAVAPNFALDWCVSAIDARERSQLDLSNLKQFFSTGERIRPETLRAFCAAFAGSGFDPAAFRAYYGATEVGVVAASANGGAFKFDRAALDAGALEPTAAGAVELQSSGAPLEGVTVRIVDPEGCEPLAAGRIGEIWIKSAAVAVSGYWNREQESEQQFRARTADGDGPFFRSGDLGGFYAGQLFVTGRLKQVINVRGQKHYAEDIEATLERQLPWIRANGTSAFADDVSGEQLLLAIEVPADGSDLAAKADAIRALIAGEFGVRVSEVLFVARGELPRTNTGKVSRSWCRQLFREDRLPILARHGARQAEQTPGLEVSFESVAREADLQERSGRIAECVRTLVAQALRVPAAGVGLDQSFREQGMDSLAGVRLRAQLSGWVGKQLPSALLYNYPSVGDVARYLAGGAAPAAEAAAPAQSERQALLKDLDVDQLSEAAAVAALEAYLGEDEDGAPR